MTSMTFNEWLQGHSIDSATLSAENRRTLLIAFDLIAPPETQADASLRLPEVEPVSISASGSGHRLTFTPEVEAMLESIDGDTQKQLAVSRRLAAAHIRNQQTSRDGD